MSALKLARLSLALLAVTGSAAFAQASPAKAELISKVLQLQRQGMEQMAALLVQQPAQQMAQQAQIALRTRVDKDKREAVAKEIQADLKKYVEEVVPPVRERVVKLAPSTVGKVLDEKFNEEELRDLIKVLESPVGRKFAQNAGEMNKALSEKLVADMRPVVDPKVKALEQSIAKRLGISPPPAAAASGAAK
ncbi:MAG: hypothetical protein RLZZ126_695 [Pseudomonadota bacterium]